MKMFSCFRNCFSLRKTKDSDGKEEDESVKKPIVIGDHPHKFYFHEQKRRGRTYDCKGCQQPGFGPHYLCTSSSCNFHYHKHCGDILRGSSPPICNHRPYPVGRYIYEKRAPSKVRYCVACGDQVRGLRYKVWHEKALGSSNLYWRYYQHRNNRAFHPLCTLLPPRIQDPGRRKLVLELREKIQGECPICKGKAKGWAYNSTCGKYCYHVGCVKKKMLQSWQNGGNDREMTLHVDIHLPQIQEVVAAAIQLIIGALLGVPDVTGIFIVLFHWISTPRRSS